MPFGRSQRVSILKERHTLSAVRQHAFDAVLFRIYLCNSAQLFIYLFGIYLFNTQVYNANTYLVRPV